MLYGHKSNIQIHQSAEHLHFHSSVSFLRSISVLSVYIMRDIHWDGDVVDWKI